MKEADVFRQADQVLKDALKEELRDQGHYLTGTLENSIHGTFLKQGNTARLVGTALYYSKILHWGVQPGKVPFRRGSGGKSSKFIDGLTRFWELKGLSGKEAVSAAFATAIKMKKEGMPTSGSYQYSSTGKRTGFIQDTDGKVSQEVNRVVLSGYDQLIDEKFKATKSETI